MSAGVRPRALLIAAIGAVVLSTAPARAESKKEAYPDPSWYVDPKYEPEAHGGLPYATYLRLSRGRFRRSTGMMVTGIVLVGAGSTVMAIGTGVYAGAHCNNEFPTADFGFGGSSCSAHPAQVSGMAMLIAGAIVTGLGIPMWIVGASGVPWAESGANDRAPTRSTAARLVPVITPAATGRGVALTWQF